MSKHKNTTETVVENESVPSEPNNNDHQKSDLPVVEQSSAGLQERILQLEQELQQALQAKDENYNRLLRIQADFENFRRRSRQEYEQVCRCAGEDIIKKMLPVVDSLERAIHCFTESSDYCSWQDGVQLTLKQFNDILKSEGVEPVNALNEAFDPLIHEAVVQEESEAVEAPTVIAELQKGYQYRNKLLRPALVKVTAPKVRNPQSES
jgi:molecular chaperone GrpE